MKSLNMESPIARRRTVSACVAILVIASSAVAQQAPRVPPNPYKTRIERALESLQQEEAKLEGMEARLQDAEHERDEILARQISLREALIEHQMPPESVSEVLSKLALELIDVEVELHGKQGRIDAIEQAIAAQAARSREEADRDEVLAKLMQIVELRQTAVARMSEAWKVAQVGVLELQRAQVDLAEAELRLAVRRGELADGATALATLNEQLLETTIDVAELESRRKYISGRLVAVRPFVELGTAELRLKYLDDRIRHSQYGIQSSRPRVESLRGNVEREKQAAARRSQLAPPSAEPPVEQRPPSDSSSKD